MEQSDTAVQEKKNFTVIIPTLNPDQQLCTIVEQLHAAGVNEIIIVDDGSDVSCREIFKKLESCAFCSVLHHGVNRGKGAALRTAFMKYLTDHPDGPGCITADDDGQHRISDILKVAEKFRQHPRSIILGKRDFSDSHVPWKSRFGNVMTRLIFRLLAGARISDTQTGLRAIPVSVMEDSLDIKGDRFEFETEMLLRAWDSSTPFREIVIQTVYLNNNEATHFHPVRDAVRIYRVILAHLLRQMFRFILVSMSSALIDFLIFFGLTQFNDVPDKGKRASVILLATVSARVISAVWNYLLNRFWVFSATNEKKAKILSGSISYFLLCLCILGASYGLTLFSSRFIPYRYLPYMKVVIDTFLFLVSFFVQKLLIFRVREK